MDEVLLALRCGRLSFTTFERRTRGVWTALAEMLLRRWRGPVAVSVDDVRQELLLNAWIFCAHWQPDRGTAISRFVVYNATDKAKKWLHQQRNAYRRDDKLGGRFEVPFSALNLTEHAAEHLLDPLAVDPVQGQSLEQRQMLALATLRAPAEHVPAMVALTRTGDLELAAAALKQSTPACVALRLTSMDDARRAVSRALHAVA